LSVFLYFEKYTKKATNAAKAISIVIFDPPLITNIVYEKSVKENGIHHVFLGSRITVFWNKVRQGTKIALALTCHKKNTVNFLFGAVGTAVTIIIFTAIFLFAFSFLLSALRDKRISL
jgi:hypothetical protein